MKKFFKYKYEILVVVLPVALIVFGLYKSEMKPFERVFFSDVNQYDVDKSWCDKYQKAKESVRKFENNTIIAENEEYILKKDANAVFILINKKSKKIVKKFKSDGKDSYLIHLIGKRCFLKQSPVYTKNVFLTSNDKYLAQIDKYGYLQIVDKKSKKLVKKFDMFDEIIMSAKFSNQFLFYYSNGIDAINLHSLKKVENMNGFGIEGSYSKIFPIKTGVVVFVVVKHNFSNDTNSYLLYYQYKNNKKELKFENIYRLKKFIYAIYMKHGVLYINLNDRIYKIYSQADELEYEME